SNGLWPRGGCNRVVTCPSLRSHTKLRALSCRVCDKSAAMFSLQKVLGKDDKFFKLMEGSAEEARASIQCLVKLLKHPGSHQSLDPFAEIRRKDKRLTQELSEHLC